MPQTQHDQQQEQRHEEARPATPRRAPLAFGRRIAVGVLCIAALAAPTAAPLGAQSHGQGASPESCDCVSVAPPPFGGAGPTDAAGDGDDDDRRRGLWWLLGGLGVFMFEGGGSTSLGARAPSDVAATELPAATVLQVTSRGPSTQATETPRALVAGDAPVPATAVPWPGVNPAGSTPARNDAVEAAALRRFEADQREGATKPLLAAALLEAAACGVAVVYRAHRRSALLVPRARVAGHAATPRRTPALAEAMAKLRSATPKPRPHAPASHRAPATAHHRAKAPHSPPRHAPRPPAARAAAARTIALDCPPMEPPVGPR